MIIDSDEIAAAVPDSNKTLEIEAFIARSDLTPDKIGSDVFTALRDAMEKSKVAAIAGLLSSAVCARFSFALMARG